MAAAMGFGRLVLVGCGAVDVARLPAFGPSSRNPAASWARFFRKINPHINAYGGEDRFWMGPEGGQFSIFFKPGDPFDLGHWQTPAVIDSVPYAVVALDDRKVSFRHQAEVVNYSETRFNIQIDRTIELLDRETVSQVIGNIGTDVPLVSYRTINTITNQGIFVSFKDNTSGNYDVYGQHIAFDGTLMATSGLSISVENDDQQSSTVAYSQEQDEVLICYEVPDGSETDIFCNEINLSDQSVDEPIVLSDNIFNQNNPSVYWSGHSFMISWEDSRNSTDVSPEQDIYFQEYNNGNFSFGLGGQATTTFDKKQERPLISKYSETENVYLILWEDYRSTGKEFCANLYGQSFSS